MIRKNCYSLKPKLLNAVLCFLLFLSLSAKGQNVDISGGAGGINGTTHATLQAAFALINGAGSQAGQVITITIKNNTTETGSAVLNMTGWNTLNIVPQGVVSVSGNLAGPLVDFDGADRVNINGLISGVRSLTFENSNTGTTSATIRFINEATQNTISGCIIKGSSLGQMTQATHGAVVWFSTTNTSLGNSSNIISNNDIGPSGANFPYICIRSNGTTTTINHNNRLNTISDNLIHDYFYYGGTQSNANGITAFTGTDAWTITGNRIYQTTTKTYSTGGSGAADRIVFGINIRSGGGYTISGNIIGYANSSGTGYSTFSQGGSNIASMFHGIVLQNNATLSTIDGNTIGGIDLTSSRATAVAGENIFLGIDVISGTVNVTNNTIGTMGAGAGINIRSTAISSTSPTPACGIYIRNATCTVSGNNIGAIALIWTSPPGTTGNDRTSLYCIYTTSGGTKIISNTIGSTAAQNISNSSSQGNVIGIATGSGYSAGVIRQNIIRNLAHLAANTGTGNASSVIGILNQTNNATADTIVSNQITILRNLASGSSAVSVIGIRQSPIVSGNSFCIKNYVGNLSAISTSTSTVITGISLAATSNHHLQNNMISLGPAVSSDYVINGVLHDAGQAFVYFNSIRITGSVSSGANNTYAYNYNVGGAVQFRALNNIYYNDRTGGSGTHYAVRIAAVPSSWAGSTLSNYNLFYTTNAPVARWLSTDCNTLNDWYVASGNRQDNPAFSRQLPVVFASLLDLHTTDLNVRNAGTTVGLVVPVTQDWDDFTRPSCVDIGCDEYDASLIAGNTWTWLGTTDDKWCSSCNWDRETVPLTTSDVLILDDRTRYPLLQSGAGCGNVSINNFSIQNNTTPSKSGQIDLATYALSVTGNVDIKGNCLCTGSTPFSGIATGLLDVTGTSSQQILDIRSSSNAYPGTLCKLRINKTQPTNVAGNAHEAILKGNLLIQYNLDFSNGVLISQTGSSYDADELTATNYKTITVLSDESNAVTRQTIGVQNTRNGFFEGRLNRKIKTGGGNEYLFPLGYRRTGGTGILADYFYSPALLNSNSVTNNQYLCATYLNSNTNGTVDGVGIGFSGHGCGNAFEIDDQGGQTASTCNNAEIDLVGTFYWDFQESSGAAANGNPNISAGALGAVDYDLECAGDKFNILAMDGLTGSELRLMNRNSVTIPGNTGQGPWVSTQGTHNGSNISANTGISMYNINAANLQGARRDGLSGFGGFVAAGNGPSPLPVELLYFTAEKSEVRNVICRWETASELNNDYFEVEVAREQSGNLEFSSIGRIQGHGTTSVPLQYSFTDRFAINGKNYYRLKQTDYDGTSAYSQVVVVQFEGKKKFDVISVSPNPFVSKADLYLQTPEAGRLSVKLENTLGQTISNYVQDLPAGVNSLALPFPEYLSSGVYFIRVRFDGEEQRIRIVKR